MKEKKQWVSIAIEKQVYDKVKTLADGETRTVSNMVRKLILGYKIYLLKEAE